MPIPSTEIFNRSFMRDDVYQSLRKWIISGELEPGEKLKDKELAAQLGVSRTPVRESLRKLEDEGLVETAPNRWTRVSLIRFSDAEHIYPIIEQLELLSLSLAFPHLSKHHVQQMRKLNVRLNDALEDGNAVEAASVDSEFHQIVIDAAGNSELSSVLEQLKVKYHRIELTYFSSLKALTASVEEHEAIVSALEEKNIDAARAALSKNWHASIERLRVTKDESGERSNLPQLPQG